MKLVRITLFVLVAFFMVGLTNAQTNKLKFGAGAYIGLPLGSFGDVTSIGFGGIVQGEYDLAPQIVGTATAGYLVFSGKSVNGFDYGSWSVIPILVGGKYFFSPNFYGAVQVGLNFVSYTNKNVPTGFNYLTGQLTYGEVTYSSSEFGFNFGVGYEMKPFDFLVKYGTFGTSTGNVSLTALYKFTL
jgi:hypothetical protein